MNNTLKHGDRVRVHLYTREGILLGSIEGTVSDFSPNTEVAPGVRKNLVWVTNIEGYERPNELGEPEPADEGWFADTDIEKIEEDRPRFFSN
ncbi:MAG: hypothetical protein ABJF88_01540 [Rhodothermales bacterium]